MKDGFDKWWDVSQTPADWISYRSIKDWKSAPAAFREERDRLLVTIKPFDLHATQHDSPRFKANKVEGK